MSFIMWESEIIIFPWIPPPQKKGANAVYASVNPQKLIKLLLVGIKKNVLIFCYAENKFTVKGAEQSLSIVLWITQNM
jgi:hypothetical protein